MSEKRFYELASSIDYYQIWDKQEDKGYTIEDAVDKLNEQQDTITKLEQICETKMQEIEDIKYGLKEIAYKYRKEVQFKADTDPNQAVKEVLGEQQAKIDELEKNFDDIVKWATTIAIRNVELDEKIGRLQREN